MRIAKLILPVLVLFLISCGEEEVYNEYVQVPESGWSQDSTLHFDVVISDTTLYYGVIVQFRHNTDYPYQNLWLNRDISINGTSMYSDHVDYKLGLPTGEWIGEGFGALKSLELPYKRNALRFNNPGTYRFTFQHGMRDEVLTGIEDFGIRIITLKDETNG